MRVPSRCHAVGLAFAIVVSLVATHHVSTPAAAQSTEPPRDNAAIGTSDEKLPPVVVETPKEAKPEVAPPSKPDNATLNKPKSAAPSKPKNQVSKPKAAPVPEPAGDVAPAVTTEAVPAEPIGSAPTGNPAGRKGSLGVPNTAEATAEIERTPGAVEVVPDTAYKGSTPAVTIKDALDYVPGVFVQPKWGEDSRLSIRGSGLSRNFHLRGLQLYMDGIPIHTADGFGDFQEIDPTAYRYIEVYKGANALRYGANSLGGAINFVMPTGYDANLFGARFDIGSFGFKKVAASSGAVAGPVDYFITGTWQEQDGFRDHSDGDSVRGSLNVGYRITEDFETRFYVNANDVEQRIPGAVTKEIALNVPTQAAFINELNDWQRNIETVRVANRTTLRFGETTTLEAGGFYVDRHLMHPIFRWLDYTYDDYGGFARLTDDRTIAGHDNRFLIGVTLHDGKVDAQQFNIGPGAVRGTLLSRTDDKSENVSVYGENAFDLVPNFALVAGFQYLDASRTRDVVFSVVGDQEGRQSFEVWNGKIGLLWDVDPGWQIFANVSESSEVPSFGENTVGSTAFTAKLQEAVTYEIGTRGARENFNWDLALYRAEIDNELQCLTLVFPFFTNTCAVTNADRTVHQGIELGFGAALLQSMAVSGPDPDKLWLQTAYTLNDFKFDGDKVWGNNELPGAPRHFIRAELLYKHPSGVFFGPNLEWVPEAYYIDNANTVTTEKYAIWGAKLGYDSESFTAYIEGRNLSDEAYISSANVSGDLGGADGNHFEPGNGAAVYGGVQMKW